MSFGYFRSVEAEGWSGYVSEPQRKVDYATGRQPFGEAADAFSNSEPVLGTLHALQGAGQVATFGLSIYGGQMLAAESKVARRQVRSYQQSAQVARSSTDPKVNVERPDGSAVTEAVAVEVRPVQQSGQELNQQTATKVGARKLPETDFPWKKYQQHVTGKNYEEVWTVSQRKVALDARNAGYIVEAKWTGANAKAWEKSPYNPSDFRYDEAKLLDQARRQVETNAATAGGKGVRWAVSNEPAQRHMDALFLKHFPNESNSGMLSVWHVPGTGMK